MCLIVLADIKDLEKDNYILIKPNLPGSQVVFGIHGKPSCHTGGNLGGMPVKNSQL